MCEIVTKDEMKNKDQNIGNNEHDFEIDANLETTKLLNWILVLVANRSKILLRELRAFLQPVEK